MRGGEDAPAASAGRDVHGQRRAHAGRDGGQRAARRRAARTGRRRSARTGDAEQRVEDRQRVDDAAERDGERRAELPLATAVHARHAQHLRRPRPPVDEALVESCDSDVVSMNRTASAALTSAENTAASPIAPTSGGSVWTSTIGSAASAGRATETARGRRCRAAPARTRRRNRPSAFRPTPMRTARSSRAPKIFCSSPGETMNGGTMSASVEQSGRASAPELPVIAGRRPHAPRQRLPSARRGERQRQRDGETRQLHRELDDVDPRRRQQAAGREIHGDHDAADRAADPRRGCRRRRSRIEPIAQSWPARMNSEPTHRMPAASARTVGL